MREASLMKRQRHPHILELLAAFVDGCDLWMIIPFVSGGSLESLLKKGYQKVSEVLKGFDECARPYTPLLLLLLLSFIRSPCWLWIMEVVRFNMLRYKARLGSHDAPTALHMCQCLAGPTGGGDSHHHEAGAGRAGLSA